MLTSLALLAITDGMPVLNVGQIAKLLNLDRRTVQNRIYSREKPLPFPVWKEGAEHFAHVADVAAYVDRMRELAAEEAEAVARWQPQIVHTPRLTGAVAGRADDVLDVEAVAQLLQCELETVERQTRAGVLPGVKFGSVWRYPKSALLDVLHRLALANTEHPPRPVPVLPQGAASPRSRRKTPPAVPETAMGRTLLDTGGIADMLGLTREHVTDRLTKQPGFPAPVANLSQKTRRWSEVEVRDYMCRL
jgi:excisionase family DNA binding protein